MFAVTEEEHQAFISMLFRLPAFCSSQFIQPRTVPPPALSVSPFLSSCLFFRGRMGEVYVGGSGCHGGSLALVCSQGLLYSTVIYYLLRPTTLLYSSGSLKLLTYGKPPQFMQKQLGKLWSERHSVLLPQKCARLKIQSATGSVERICCTSEPEEHKHTTAAAGSCRNSEEPNI